MEKRNVLLISQPNLLGESLEYIFNSLEDVQVFGSWLLEEQALARCTEKPPDLVIITADEQYNSTASQLTTQFLEAFPNLTVIRIKQDSNFLLVYSSQSIPARMTDLIEAIRRLPILGDNSQPNLMRTGR